MLNVMITLFCVLTMLSPSHCDDLLSKIEVESSINRTVDEVEKLIRLNSTLPRLSRHEIVDILFNITSKDLEAYQDKEAIEEARRIYQRALMVVLPYNAENAKEDINDLYTKPPIVEIIPDSSSPEDFKAWRNKKLEAAKLDKEPLENLVVTHASEKATKTRYKNHKETYSEVQTKVPLEVTMKFDSAPVKFSFDLDNLQKPSTITEKSETVKRPVYQRPPSYSVNDENAASATSTISSKEPHTSTPSSAKYNGNILSVDQWRYNAPISTTQNSITPTKASNLSSSFLPTVKVSSENLVAPTAKSKNASHILKVTSGKMQVANTKQSTSTYMTPMSSSEKPKYSSTYSLNSGGFRTITTARPEVMDLLAAIGLRPENTTNVEEVFKKNKLNVEINSRIPNSDGVSHTVTSSLTTVDSPSVTQNAFGNSVPEIGKGMSNLTPDVQLLFQRFGLQASGNTVVPVTTPTPKSTTNINSYTNFKPLPTSKIKDQEMREFLAKFGLGISDASRQKKSMPTERPSLIEAVPRNMRQILENIGLIARTTPRMITTTTTRTTTTATTTMSRLENAKPTESTKFHVFKPHEVHVKDEQQRMKISQLLDTIRLVQEGKANATDVRKVANDLLETTKTLKEGPDPLRLEEIIRIYNEDVKNEVKRQHATPETTPAVISNDDPDTVATSTLAESVDASSISTTTMTTTTTTTTTVNSTALDSAKDGSDLLKVLTPTSSTTAGTLLALEESFGATTSAPNSVLPTKRRNGLYFLVDWNSFLEVGEGSEKVNLMFQPKVGDRSRFLPITVP